jgi:hypothetical protein
LSETITCAILVNPSSAFSLFLFIVFSDFIELQPVSEYEENIELGIDLTPNIADGYVPLHTEDDEEEGDTNLILQVLFLYFYSLYFPV